MLPRARTAVHCRMCVERLLTCVQLQPPLQTQARCWGPHNPIHHGTPALPHLTGSKHLGLKAYLGGGVSGCGVRDQMKFNAVRILNVSPDTTHRMEIQKLWAKVAA